MIDYCDSAKNATGWLPRGYEKGIGLSRTESDILHGRYYTEHFDSTSNRKFWREIPPWVWSKRGVLPKYEGSPVEVVAVQKVIPNPSNDRVTLLLVAKLEHQAVVKLFSSEGKVTALWSGVLQEGENSVAFATSAFAAGAYKLSSKTKTESASLQRRWLSVDRIRYVGRLETRGRRREIGDRKGNFVGSTRESTSVRYRTTRGGWKLS